MNVQTETHDACIFCRPSQTEILIPAEALPDRVNVLRCKNCGLVFLQSRSAKNTVDPEEMAYWDDAEQKKIYMEEKVQDVFAAEFKRRIENMRELYGKTGLLLDVGCGVGHFLAAAKKQGWDVRGLDISHAASSAAKEIYNLEVKVGTLEETTFPEEPFDAVTLWDVIEHIRRPIENIRAANRLLRPGGILVMKTPDESGFFKQAALFFYRISGRRASFLLKYVYYIPHYFSYSQKTMTALLTRCGFKPIWFDHDQTPPEFSVEKIHAHYKKDPKRFLIIALLPFAMLAAQLAGKRNKMIVYAKKVSRAA